MDVMLGLSRKVQGIEESQTLALTAKAMRLKESGKDIVSLTAGEPDFPTPAHVKDAAVRAIKKDFTHYTPNRGIGDLVDAVILKFARDNGLHFTPEQILVCSGAKHAIFNVLQAICDSGDEVVILSPYWVSYPEMVKLVGAVPVIVPPGTGFRPDPEAIRKAIGPKTKALILNTPNNPAGTVFTAEEIAAIAALAAERAIYVVSDEVYERVIFDGRTHTGIGAVPGIADRVITVNGVSKAYAMTGWRIGFVGGPADVVGAAARVQSQTTSCASSISQKASVAALSGSEKEIRAMVAEFQTRRDQVDAALREIPGVSVVRPEGAMFFFFNVGSFLGRSAHGRTMRSSADIAHHLLDHHMVALVPGSSFGDDSCLRLSFSSPPGLLDEGVKRIRRGLNELRDCDRDTTNR